MVEYTGRFESVNILGIQVTSEPLAEVLAAIRKVLREDERKGLYVCATSVHGVIESRRDPHLKETLNQAFINLPDGRPLAVVGRWLGPRFVERIKGYDLFPTVCEMTLDMNVRHFFYGGKEGVAEALAQKMGQRFPGLKVAGTYSPPFRPLKEAEKDEVVNLINVSNVDIIWVGLSTPKQENWIREFHEKLNVNLLFSVGAAFDYHTGGIKPEPLWMDKVGLEWCYRLISEPRRLWKRYLKIVPTFVLLAALQLMKLRSYE